jgi:hypothetical protein
MAVKQAAARTGVQDVAEAEDDSQVAGGSGGRDRAAGEN